MLLVAIHSDCNTEIIYAQILQGELGIPIQNVTRFNPLAVRRQPLLDFLRLQNHDRIVLIGSAELLTLQFPVYLRKSNSWMLVPREKLGDLVDTTVNDPQ
jgi:hypothetical protein